MHFYTNRGGTLNTQDTFYIGAMKGMGRIDQQTYIDTYSKLAHAKLYTTKTPITADDLLNDKVLPFYEEHELPVLRVMTNRGTEFCGRADKHNYQPEEHTQMEATSLEASISTIIPSDRIAVASTVPTTPGIPNSLEMMAA